MSGLGRWHSPFRGTRVRPVLLVSSRNGPDNETAYAAEARHEDALGNTSCRHVGRRMPSAVGKRLQVLHDGSEVESHRVRPIGRGGACGRNGDRS
jgi:hypothetical protein